MHETNSLWVVHLVMWPCSAVVANMLHTCLYPMIGRQWFADLLKVAQTLKQCWKWCMYKRNRWNAETIFPWCQESHLVKKRTIFNLFKWKVGFGDFNVFYGQIFAISFWVRDLLSQTAFSVCHKRLISYSITMLSSCMPLSENIVRLIQR